MPAEYGDLPTFELVEAAETEAEAFALPQGWRDGREPMDGIAIDEVYSPDRDDAVSATLTPDGQSILHVSIVDMGAFVGQLPAVSALAQRRLASIYRDNRVVRPMLPRILSEDRLSLLPGQDRPVVTVNIPINDAGPGAPYVTNNILTATAIAPSEIEVEHTGAPSEDQLTHLGYIARRLYQARHGGNEAFSLEDEDGLVIASEHFSTGAFIVEQCMVTANMAVGQLLSAAKSPTIFRRHDLSRATQLQLGGELSEDLKRRFARARYSIEPGPHIGLRANDVAHFTSPLRRYPDYANHANLAALREGRPPFFSEHKLTHACSRHARLYQSSLPRRVHTQSKEAVHKDQLNLEEAFRKLRKNEALQADFAKIFFGRTSNIDGREVEALRREAFVVLIDKGAVARAAIDVAVEKGWATIQKRDGELYLVDFDGDAIRYRLGQQYQQKIIINALTMLSERADAGMHYHEIQRRVRRNAILKNSQDFMHDLSMRLRTPLREQSEEVGGLHTHTVTMTIRDKIETREATAATAQEARRLALGTFILDLDLIDNPPSPPPVGELESLRRETSKRIHALRAMIQRDQHNNPIERVHLFAQKNHLQVAYEFAEVVIDETTLCRCTVRILTEAGEIHENEGTLCQVEAVAHGQKNAKLLATDNLVKAAAGLSYEQPQQSKKKPAK